MGAAILRHSPWRRVRTLIVDDHAGVRFLMRAIVADPGVDVEVVGEADGAEAALAQLEALAPGRRGARRRMPRVDGFEAASLLLERRPGVPIVLCSALVDEDAAAALPRAGCRRGVSKDRCRSSCPRRCCALAGRE